jgi:hypothetical protein
MKPPITTATLIGLTFSLLAGSVSTAASASALEQRNPFDPTRKPPPPVVKPPDPPPPPPALTAKDLRLEGIVAYGAFRGVLAILDGQLKNSLPANRAGRVRIAVGQSFGNGYTLERVEPGQAIISAGTARYRIPMVRQVDGNLPPPPEPATAPPPAPPLPTPAPVAQAPGTATPAAAPAAAGVHPFMGGGLIAPGGAAAPASAPTASAAPAEATAATPAEPPPEAAPEPATAPAEPTGNQPKSLLEAILQAQQAAKNRPAGAAVPANPFANPAGTK